MNNLAERYHTALSAFELTRRLRPTLGQIAEIILPFADEKTTLEYSVFCVKRLQELFSMPDMSLAIASAERLLGGQPVDPRELSRLTTKYASVWDQECPLAEGSNPNVLASQCAAHCAQIVHLYQKGFAARVAEIAALVASAAYWAALNSDNMIAMYHLGSGLREVALQVDGQQIEAYAARKGFDPNDKLILATDFQYIKST